MFVINAIVRTLALWSCKLSMSLASLLFMLYSIILMPSLFQKYIAFLSQRIWWLVDINIKQILFKIWHHPWSIYSQRLTSYPCAISKQMREWDIITWLNFCDKIKYLLKNSIDELMLSYRNQNNINIKCGFYSIQCQEFN